MNNNSYESRLEEIMSTSRHKSETMLAGMSTFFKVMGDPTRLRILVELLEGSLCVNHICERVGMSQSAVSHQLAILRRADLVRVPLALWSTRSALLPSFAQRSTAPLISRSALPL